MDPIDDVAALVERRERVVAFIADLRGRCLNLGAPRSLVASLRVQGLLQLYRRLLADEEREHDEMARLMQEPPQAA